MDELWPRAADEPADRGERTGAAAPGRPRRLILPPAWRRFAANKAAVVGLVLLIAIVLFALGADLISRLTGFTPSENHITEKLRPPFTDGYLLGSDGNGRDILTRLAYGARTSLMVAVLATVAVLGIGATLGLVAGYLGGWVDSAVMRLVDVFMAVPLFYALILISTLYSPGPYQLAFILAAVSWFELARLARGEVLSLRRRAYIEAAVVIGASHPRILRFHILPNVMPLLLIAATAAVPAFILMEAGLSFLGMGVTIPTPSWGNMLQESSRLYRQSWTAVFIPGLMIYLTTLAVYLVGNGLRDALDAHGRR